MLEDETVEFCIRSVRNKTLLHLPLLQDAPSPRFAWPRNTHLLASPQAPFRQDFPSVLRVKAKQMMYLFPLFFILFISFTLFFCLFLTFFVIFLLFSFFIFHRIIFLSFLLSLSIFLAFVRHFFLFHLIIFLSFSYFLCPSFQYLFLLFKYSLQHD